MRAVSKEESENTKKNLLNWAEEGKISKGGTLGEWVFSNLNQNKDEVRERNQFSESLTANAIQKNWKTPCEFPFCPNLIDENSLKIYKERLHKGRVFSKNEYGESFVENSEINEITNELLVMTSSKNIKPFVLARVYIQENNFIHESIRSFFSLAGAQKQFNLALGMRRGRFNR